MLPCDRACLHVVVDVDIAADGLLIVLTLHLDLLSGQELGSLALRLLISTGILVVLQELLHVHGLLFLQMEVLDRLIVLSSVGFVQNSR